jgi:hypothetical protein
LIDHAADFNELDDVVAVTGGGSIDVDDQASVGTDHQCPDFAGAVRDGSAR